MSKRAFRNWILKGVMKRMLKDLLTLKFLEGKRTIIASAIIAVLTFLKLAGKLTPEQYAAIVGFLTSIGLITAAVHKNQ